jgi:acyl-phosphate glycerol 3-phosphate acyltransferase
MTAVLLPLTALLAYLVGAVPFGYLVGKARGVDLLRAGSGNIGATNAGRLLGRRWGLLVFFLDAAKGALPVLLAGLLPQPDDLPARTLPVVAGLSAFLGHLFPVYLRFRGGKGVATGLGVVGVLLPGPALAALLIWGVVVACTRYVSLASLSAAAALSGLRLLGTDGPWGHAHVAPTVFCVLGSALVVVRHRGNVRRLLRGTENRLPSSPTMHFLLKALHLLAVGLWFGTVVFFTLMGVVLFQAFDDVSRLPTRERPRPDWFPNAQQYEKPPPSKKFPDPLRREQGSRAFGYAVGSLFPWYYAIQLGCALVAAGTALAWAQSRPGIHRARAVVLLVALGTVGLGWLLERVVHELRGPRDEKTAAVLRAPPAPPPSPEEIQSAERAREAFGRWHGFSLIVNFLTLALVTVAMVLAAALPECATCAPARAAVVEAAAAGALAPDVPLPGEGNRQAGPSTAITTARAPDAPLSGGGP